MRSGWGLVWFSGVVIVYIGICALLAAILRGF